MKFYGKEIAPNFNSFDFWWLDENKVSSIISFFLNPHETHEHGDIYLRHFLEKFELDFFQFNERDNITIKCEFNTDKGRRIDIIIYKNNFDQAIAIENKIHIETTDQNDKITDYLNFLERKTKNNFCLIYLSPQGKPISNNSIRVEDKEKFINENKLKILSYEEHMIECINEFGHLTQNNRVKSFLKDFEKKLIRMYMGEKNGNIEKVIIDLLKNDENNLKISFHVLKSLPKVKDELKKKFENQLEEIRQELNLDGNGLELKPHNWKKNKIVFKYEQGGIIYGIKRLKSDKKKPGLPEIEILLKEKNFSEEFKVSELFAMWQFFYKDIEFNEQFWIDIHNKKAQKRAKEFIELICENFGNKNY